VEERDLRTHCYKATLVALVAALCPRAAQAQQPPVPEQPSVAPQIELDGEGVATVEGHWPRLVLPGGVRGSNSRINVSDSALLLGASQRLYRSGIGSLIIGGTTTEENAAASGTNVFLHELFLDYQTRPLEAYLGRTNTATRLIEFPTVRGDDLIEFVTVLDPYSSGSNPEEHRYGDVAALALNRKLRYFMNVHAQHLVNSGATSAGRTGVNSGGILFQYQGPPTLEAIVRVPVWGIGYERQSIPSGNGGAANVVYAGLVYNLNPDPVDRVDLRLQGVASTGNQLKSFSEVADTFRAASNTAAASVRWLHSPFGTPGHQISLTAGYRSYPHVASADTFAIALAGVKRLGEGFDLVAQYSFQHRSPAYAAVFAGARDEQSIEIGLVFNFTNIFNPHIGPRRSLLNLQHQYIPE
jgi:hypothetical protein